MQDILIVEKEEAIAGFIKMHLTEEGYHCTCVRDQEAGADSLERQRYDLVLLDIGLPEAGGACARNGPTESGGVCVQSGFAESSWKLLEYGRYLEIPVMLLAERESVRVCIEGLRRGADDYVVKPLHAGELTARVEALLRRCHRAEKKLAFADVEIDIRSRTVRKPLGAVDLTMKEFDLLVELVQNQNIALYRDRLYEKVWGELFVGNTRTLDSHIQRLRKKLGWEEHIKTIYRVGYRLEGE